MNTYSPEARSLLEELARIESEKGKLATHIVETAMSPKEAADKMEDLERQTNEIEQKLVQYVNK